MKDLQRALRRTFRPARKPDAARKARELAKRLGLAHGIEIEALPGGGFNVWPPAGFTPDPREGDHYAADWDEVLKGVQAYVPAAAPGAPSATWPGEAYACLQGLGPDIKAMLNDSLCNDEASSDEEMQAHWCAQFGLTAEQAEAAITFRARSLADVFFRPFAQTFDQVFGQAVNDHRKA